MLTALVYLPGLTGGFYLDDFVQIVQNPYLKQVQFDWASLRDVAVTSTSGPTGRPVSMLSFAADQLLYGLTPMALKAGNLLIHLLNGLLLYLLLLKILPRLHPLTRRQAHRPALVLAALWLFHPLHVSSVLYAVQRMTLLATMFSLAALAGYCHWRWRARPRLLLALGSLSACTLLAILSKENGALTFCYAALIELFLFRFQRLPHRSRNAMQGVFIGLPVVAAIGLAVFWLSHPGWGFLNYGHRPFDMAERLMSEARALAFYQKLILLPDLLAMGLHHDDFAISRSLFDPPATAFAILWHCALLAAAWIVRKRAPAFSFGIAWFYTGHLMESTILPLELVFEHRNYLAAAGLPLALYGILVAVGERARHPAGASRTTLWLGGLAALFLALTAARAEDWGDFFAHPLMEAERSPDSARSQFEAGIMLAHSIILEPELATDYYDTAKDYLWKSAHLAPNAIAPLVTLTHLQSKQLKRIDPAVIDELRRRLGGSRPHASMTVNLHSLIRQILEDDGTVYDQKTVEALLNAPQHNPHLGAREKAEALVGMALYLKGQNEPLERIIGLLERAIALRPAKPDYRILLAGFQIDAARLNDAVQTLARLDQESGRAIFRADIAKLRQQIAPAANPSDQPTTPKKAQTSIGP